MNTPPSPLCCFLGWNGIGGFNVTSKRLGRHLGGGINGPSGDLGGREARKVVGGGRRAVKLDTKVLVCLSLAHRGTH